MYTINPNPNGGHCICIGKGNERHIVGVASEHITGLFGFTHVYYRDSKRVIQGHGLFPVGNARALKQALIQLEYDPLEALHIAYRVAASTLSKQKFNRQAIVQLFEDLDPPKASGPYARSMRVSGPNVLNYRVTL